MRGLIMNFKQAVTSVFKNYATFSGRAPRSEYWWWVLFTVLLYWVAGLLDGILFADFALMHYEQTRLFTPISSLVGLAMWLPSIAVGVRRFHDMDRTGWWLLLIISGIGAFIVTVWFMFRGTPGPNRFGPDPFGRF